MINNWTLVAAIVFFTPFVIWGLAVLILTAWSTKDTFDFNKTGGQGIDPSELENKQ